MVKGGRKPGAKEPIRSLEKIEQMKVRFRFIPPASMAN